MARAAKVARWLTSPRRLALLLRAAWAGVRGHALLRRLPIPAFMARWTPPVGHRRWDPDEFAQATDLALSALRRRRCLLRSLVLYRLLRQAGRPAQFVMGVRRDPGGAILGHAWLERDGQEVHPYGEDATRYTVNFRFP